MLKSNYNRLKAFINFDGTSASIGSGRASFNVSSVTDNGVGDYIINFIAPMIDTNYCVFQDGGAPNTNVSQLFQSRIDTMLTTSVRVKSGVLDANRNLQAEDRALFCLGVFR